MLMAVDDTNCTFTLIDVGDLGKNSNGAVFRHSSFGKLLKQGKCNVPNATGLPQDTNHELFPYYLICNEAFPLLPYFMWQFPEQVLNDGKIIFNFRLSRGGTNVECTFGMLTSKFHVFDGPIACNEDCTIAIIKGACVIHNFIHFL
ncbi:hypothetical protein PR048_007685 [Dryococelus australis]|uniref:DDE Tnp4 domain-containing protein n=1 Tax=Dryococelus australis TaxID=614101 RepID=A0ABQ9HUX9_9NEOP|nr:hypothetical protein PR048_007685 [Dryococelus australis]